jgi:hypothetical protein
LVGLDFAETALGDNMNSIEQAIVHARTTGTRRKQVGCVVMPSMSRVVCDLLVAGRQEEPMCRCGITQCLRPVNARAVIAVHRTVG